MKLSVIVPSYNVSNYLEECIESIVIQELESMEIIIVNDGSTDNTLEIAKKLEREFNQVIVIDQPNGGLGNARNTGARYAKGEYLTFVDSDDVITLGAYKLMLNTIEKSGSDFVIGNVVRFNSTKTYPSVLHKRIFREDLIGVSLREHHELIYDTTAWNKIYRMDFWKKYEFQFPENMLYEDIPVTIPAHAVAEKVDVLTKVVYKWRARDSGDFSITQQKGQIENFVDRVKGIDMVRDFFKKYGISEELKRAYDFKNLHMDFPLYLSYMLEADKKYQTAVADYITKYLSTVDTNTFLQLSVLQKIKYRLIELNRFDDFLQVLRNDRVKKNEVRPEEISDGYTFPYQYLEVLTKEEQRADIEFTPTHWVEKVVWQDDDLLIEGVAYLNRLSFAKRSESEIDVKLVSESLGHQIHLSKYLKRKTRLDVTIKKGIDIGSKLPFKRLYNYNQSGYSLRIPRNIIEQMNSDETYFIQMTISHGFIRKEFNIGLPKPGFSTKPHYRKLDTSVVVPEYNAAWDLKLKRRSLKSSIEKFEFTNRTVILSGKISEPDQSTLRMVNCDNDEELYELETQHDGDAFKAVIPEEMLDKIFLEQDMDKVFSFSFRSGESLTRADESKYIMVGYDSEYQITVVATSTGDYLLRFSKIIPIVQKISRASKGLSFDFILPTSFFKDAVNYSVILLGMNESYSLEHEIKEQNEEITRVRAYTKWFLPTEDRTFKVMLKKKLKEATLINSRVENGHQFSKKGKAICDEPELCDEYLSPIYLFNIGIDKILKKKGGIKYELYHPLGSHRLQYRVSSYWERLDDGPRRQEIVKRVLYPMWRKLSVKNDICILESFWGREFSDNPKAIYDYMSKEYPNMRYIVPLQDTLQKVEITSKNTQIVKINSWRYLYYLARGKYFVNNVNFPDYYQKRKEAVEIQTMHGTPLKRLGLDNPGEIPEHQIEKFIQKCKRWDYLTIPSDYVGEIAKSAYHFDGVFLKIGYPRNDSLFENSESIRNELLTKYGLQKNKKVILYAPTWRVKGNFSMPMDLHKMKEELGNEYILIIKLHHYMVANFSLEGLEDFAYLFDKGSIISDFYKIADMLITDYSSVMFDYAILKKPMIFFTYDYDNYKDNLRGMYFDFKKDAPGPMVETTDELIDEITHILDYQMKYAEKIEGFTKKFIQYDTGDASRELVERVIDR